MTLGHPAFPIILALGGHLVIRSNWKTYCEEMIIAVQQATSLLMRQQHRIPITYQIENFQSDNPLTHFEKKFLKVGVSIFQIQFELGRRNCQERTLFLDGLKLIDKQSSMSLTASADYLREVESIHSKFLPVE
jgi:hypothetical protein